MTRFDIHLNVGDMWGSKKPTSRQMFYSGKEIADYCNFFKLTHTVCIYSDYKYIEELQREAPNTKVYGMQWIVDLENQQLDIGKPLFYGIKLHSNRGFRDAKHDLKGYGKHKDGLSYGLDYTHQSVKTLLEQLPEGVVVMMHTQGSTSVQNTASPAAVFALCQRFPNLKFLMGHAGDYGGTFKPSFLEPAFTCDKMLWSKEQISYTASIAKHGAAVQNIFAANSYTKMTHNLFLDTSKFSKHKGKLLQSCEKWAIGSDYPFGANNKKEGKFEVEDFDKMRFAPWHYDTEERLFNGINGVEQVLRSQENAVHFMETPIQILFEEFKENWFSKEYLFDV